MRQVGMGVGPIPMDKIAWEAERMGMDLLEQEAFEYVIRAVDVAYLNMQAEKRTKEARRK
jgi:adenylosuccinate synthase